MEKNILKDGGNPGKLAQSFINLIKDLQLRGQSVISPVELKYELSNKCVQFKGYNQHDSQ